MTFVLQTVDETVGRSFKCAFKHLLADYVLAYVNKKWSSGEGTSIFKMNDAVTTYYAVVLIKKAWDMVPVKVILNYWLKTGILYLIQRAEV